MEEQKPPSEREPAEEQSAKGAAAYGTVDYRHAKRIVLLFAGLVAAALLARCLAVPESFGQYGHYRGKALAEARKKKPRHLGKKSCAVAGCHAKRAKLHAKDAHARVQCEDCHGPGAGHIVNGKKARKMKVAKGKALCLTCHRRLQARPSSFAQIDWQEHFEFVGVKDKSIGCTTCHDPHEPLFMDRDLHKARLHPIVHRCRDCHAGSKRTAKTKRPKDHPAIFECSYCHKALVKDFATRNHKNVRCTTCHIFFKESSFAGRILKDADPRFCLLCHQAAKYRADSKPPKIKWPSHREEMGDGEADAKKVCVDCHRENIHLLYAPARLTNKRGVAAQVPAKSPAASAPATQPATAGKPAAKTPAKATKGGGHVR